MSESDDERGFPHYDNDAVEPDAKEMEVAKWPQQVSQAPTQAANQTPSQAKVDAIAALTMSAYQKASMLDLTDEEIAALTREFPDEAFKPGAAGKENLIYIEHAFLRDRLNDVFKPGKWAIVPRNRWEEDFTTRKGDQASRVYVEAMLCIRGCFAAEAVGEMEYYPANASQNYGDAVEGAKTAALRRCCKELGIGLQAWKKDWCLGWWARRRALDQPQRPQGAVSTPKPEPAPPKPATAVPKAPEPPKHATDKTRTWFVGEVLKVMDERSATEWFANDGWILPNVEGLKDLPLDKIPTNRGACLAIINRMIGLPEDTPDGHDGIDAPWWDVICPVPHKGEKRDEYLKDPETIRILYRKTKDGDLNARARLFGFALSKTYPETRTVGGKTYPPSQADHDFRAALDAFLEWHSEKGLTEGAEV